MRSLGADVSCVVRCCVVLFQRLGLRQYIPRPQHVRLRGRSRHRSPPQSLTLVKGIITISSSSSIIIITYCGRTVVANYVSTI